jgi:hypothetical protein
VVFPGGHVPAEGETVTVKFDPHKRREFVLVEESHEVTIGCSERSRACALSLLELAQPF